MIEQRADDEQITFRQAVPMMIWVLAIIVVGALVKFYVLGHRPYDKNFKPVEHNFKLTEPTTRN
jgi:hypothetical protein